MPNSINELAPTVIEGLKNCCQSVDECRNIFIRHGESETKTAMHLLNGRAALVFLKTKSTSTSSTSATPTQSCASLLVISFHSFNPKRSPDRLTYLLFELVENLFLFTAEIPVLICGDFNEDIRASTSLQTFLSKHELLEYSTVFPRVALPCINFIILRKTESQTCTINVEAKKMEVPTKIREDIERQLSEQESDLSLEGKIRQLCKDVSNHSPLVATVMIKTKSESKDVT